MPKIFKAGDYGRKGTYSVDTLKSWVGKEFNITAGHVGDWTKNGYPVTAIPIAGTCKVTEVDDQGYLIGEFAYNSLGESIKDQYPNLSIGIGEDGTPNHLAILGYAPPHLKDLDQSFSEFSQDLTAIEKAEIIEFAEEDAQSKIDEFIAFFRTVDVSKVNYKALFDVLYEKDDEKYAVNKLKDLGYTVEKTAEFSEETLKSIANTLGMVVTAKQVNDLTPEEIYAKAKAEFTREAEKEETKKNIIKMFPPVMHKILEFAIDKAYEESEYTNIIEFSEDDKTSMATKLKEFSEKESPFKELFKNISETLEFNKDDMEETPQEKAKRIASLY
ncbi:hypothetical protein [uncultured Fusobacterium sp.]|uniref:hypothetical protein n=1 Tax=uncultured Fusobacterium sp. TaxID=159267 RepID=UPI0015A64A78|nr:hypothetical protein [uncultured Fusobacterium sp.]DAQ00470.1 MAG TPA: hypothetical protein [Caudoviricetes sp.]